MAVSNDAGLEIIDRQHIVVAEANVPGSKQPYHYAENLPLKEAEEYIARCSTASGQLASAAVREILSQLKKSDHRVLGSAILTASGRTLPSLDKILASHALIHTAEGEFFRTIVQRACEQAGVRVTRFRERELEERTKKAFGRQSNQITRRIAMLGKQVGAPWTQDEKLAALGAILVLAAGEPSVAE